MYGAIPDGKQIRPDATRLCSYPAPLESVIARVVPSVIPRTTRVCHSAHH